MIAYVTGRLFSPGQTARFPAQSYGASLTTVLDAAQRDENSLVRDYTVRELEAFIDLLVAAR